MIQSRLIANRGEIACLIIRTQILPGTGRWQGAALTEGAQLLAAELTSPWDPSARSSEHLPVPGRIWDPSARLSGHFPVPGRM